jgi:hypothetical protein
MYLVGRVPRIGPTVTARAGSIVATSSGSDGTRRRAPGPALASNRTDRHGADGCRGIIISLEISRLTPVKEIKPRMVKTIRGSLEVIEHGFLSEVGTFSQKPPTQANRSV